MTANRLCLIALLLGGVACAQTAGSNDPLARLRLFEGRWEGEAHGQPGSGKSTREYRFVMNGRYLEVRNRSVYPAQEKNPKGEVHEDWGMISYDRGRKTFVLRQFHSEGFVNQYAAATIRDRIVIFESEAIENIPAGFRARETYTITGPNAFTERFEIAEPGKDFEVYCETQFRRKP